MNERVLHLDWMKGIAIVCMVQVHTAAALPDGLEVNETGVIEGTPTSLTSGSYAIMASNGGGSDTFDLEISVIPPPPGAFEATTS